MTVASEWSKAVVARDGKCEGCGAVEGLHAMRRDKDKPYVPGNGLTICGPCRVRVYAVRKRPVKIKTERPQRRTMMAKIAELEAVVTQLGGNPKGGRDHPKNRFPNPWPQE